ncbi:MAG: ANTAR domain-containing protein [Clostridia bacterium]|nr:ANTAR domain-containing protein [Clostridia bacterium]
MLFFLCKNIDRIILLRIRRVKLLLHEKILIIMQDQKKGKVYQNLFLNSGFKTALLTDDPFKGIRILRTQEIQLILLDDTFQGMSFKQFADVIDYENLGAIIILGTDSLPSLQDFPPSVYGILNTPVSREMLLNSARMAIRQYKINTRLKEELKDLRKKLSDKKVIDQAKFFLMDKYKIDESQAYDRLRKVSMDKRVSIRKLAESIISEK